jgi:hypothetical protein
MKEINCLSIPFYEFQCNEDLVNRVLEEVKQIDFGQNLQSVNYYNEELIDWFSKCISEVHEICNFSESLELKVSECWATKTRKLLPGNFHFHVNSILSGVMYLTEGSKTKFRTSNPYFSAEDAGFMSLSKAFGGIKMKYAFPIEGNIVPEKGKLIIFPSSIEHQITPHTGNFSRHSIAFNTFPSGVTCKDITGKLELDTKFSH